MGRKQRTSQGPRTAVSLVDAVLKKYGAQKPVREHRLVTGWREIVGERVAARAWPDGLKDGVLSVRVANSAWLHELSFLRDVVTERANELVGPPSLVREVRFHLGGRRAADAETEDDVVAELARQAFRRRRPAPRTLPPPSQATLDRIDRETSSIGDPDLRETLRVLRRRLGM